MRAPLCLLSVLGLAATSMARAEDCPEIVPSECLSVWQAHARGWLSVTSGGSGGATISFTNTGPYDVCLDAVGIYNVGGAQGFFLDADVVTSELEIGPGATVSFYYASWTTANGYYSPYLGSYGWWCMEQYESTMGGTSYPYTGEGVPEALQAFTSETADMNGNGRPDITEWYGSHGVLANYNVWSYQATHPVLTAGKVAETIGGQVDVTLLVRNVGAVGTTGVLTDTVPAGWSYEAVTPAPLSETLNADGSVTLTWDVDLSSAGGIAVYERSITYTLVRNAASDAPYLYLGQSSVAYSDGAASQTSTSLPTGVYNVDVSGDGVVSCWAEEICNDIDDDLDGEVDEGFDADGDGVTSCGGDCDDWDGSIHPGAAELCDGLDNDCDGEVSATEQDEDSDGMAGCEGDCDDANADVHPDAIDFCNGLDDDCDGETDEDATDCGDNDCPDLVPEECLSLWEAHSRGWLKVGSSLGSGAAIEFTNVGPYDVCIDAQGLYNAGSSQGFFVDPEVLTTPMELAPGESQAFYYGSWTTDNGVFSPYLGEDAWWCIEIGEVTASGIEFPYTGEGVPSALAWFVENDTDLDGDGVEDHLDWAGSYGVQANYNIWSYQSANPVFSVGKFVEGTEVTVSSRNIGYLAGAGVLYDRVPAGWTWTSASPAPDTVISNADGTTTLGWNLDLAGTSGGYFTDDFLASYILERDADVDSDAMKLELGQAWVEYGDTEGDQTSWSLPATAFNLDLNSDGVVECADDEICDGMDNDQDGWVDEGFDADGDGVTSCAGDCDDTQASIHPGASESCNAIDDDCDGIIPATELDGDGDGMAACEGDCDDADASRYAGAPELCDRKDNDCDGALPAGETDGDGDGMTACEGDCDDADATRYAGAAELCDRKDNDCDGILPASEADVDGDGMSACEGDCDDAAAAVHPSATEVCDSIDNDCDGRIDDADSSVTGRPTWYYDADSDTWGGTVTKEACTQPTKYVSRTGDCNDARALVNPGATEVCDATDNDCDGLTDDADPGVTGRSTWYRDADADTYGGSTTTLACTQPSGYTNRNSDCDDTKAAVNPGATEICDAIDNDCDAKIDDADPSITGQKTWYRDVDADTYGSTTSTKACTRPSGYVSTKTDCNDAVSSIHPGALEYCDDLDDDCDSLVDEGLSCGEGDCPEIVPETCLSLWEAHSRGWVTVKSNASYGSIVEISNVGPYDVCVDALTLYYSDSTQNFFVDPKVVAAEKEIAPGATLSFYYGSWTTDNKVYSPYLGRDAWWCVQSGRTAAKGQPYAFSGEDVPAVLVYYIENNTDTDADGKEDHVDWAGSYGVKANYNIWNYQAANPVLTAGKTLTVTGSDVDVTVHSRNIGSFGGEGVLYDTIPAGWAYDGASPAPDEIIENDDGSLTLAWNVVLDGAVGTTYDALVATYTLYRDAEADSDAPALELPVAWVDYLDTHGDQTSMSLPATAFNVDVSGDGQVDCSSPEVCDGLDNDLDGFIDEDFDADGDGWTTCEGDCDDASAGMNPGETESCNGIDDDCDGIVPDTEIDDDLDGLAECEGDCADTDATVYAGASELCDGKDNDCDGVVPSVETDDDGDGMAECEGDCDDDAATVYAGAAELCDRLDNDCDGVLPASETDGDGDGVTACEGDCEDADATIYTGATELCDRKDNDCDGVLPASETDGDGDGMTACEGDCTDTDATVYAGASELCDRKDNDCDGVVPAIETDGDGDGMTACEGDCDDTQVTVYAGASELCDGLDNDCDGVVPAIETDGDGDGLVECEGDCNDADAAIFAGASELCDGKDNDCDGVVPVIEIDNDGDGVTECNGDCDDAAASVYPGALDFCNEVDDDCDGSVDDAATDCGGDDCEALVPEVCLNLWEAHSRGWVQVASSTSAGSIIQFTNVGPYDICIDALGLYNTGTSQGFFVDPEIVAEAVEIAPGDTLSFYYGSWTTANGSYAPYLGRDAWWCMELGQTTASGVSYPFYGEGVPDALAYFIENDTDLDGDGKEDHVDWAGSYGVQANYNIWNYEATNPVLTAGKVVEGAGSAADVTLIARNIGYVDGTGILHDVIPAGWTFTSLSVEPDVVTANADGTVTLTWNLDLDGTGGGIVTDDLFVTYSLVRNAEVASDAMKLELAEAWVTYTDSLGDQTSWSLPATTVNLDVNGNGVVECAAEEICDGLDNDQDGWIDNGFDQDGDGWTTCEADCDDTNPTVFPTAPELCDRIDNDCDSVLPAGEVDADEDGMTACEGDCNDTEVTIYAGAPELCDRDDNDCDGVLPATESDEDGDGIVECDGDCADEDATVYPGATELCDGLDNDCDGSVPSTETDGDGDGLVECDGDCNDADASIFDGASELCDGKDNDCDGVVPATEIDNDGDGSVECGGDCDDGASSVYPGALDYCNEVDDDCDGAVDDAAAECGGDDCEDLVPDTCLPLVEAHARGWITVHSSDAAGTIVNFTNVGPYPVCFDALGLYSTSTSQGFFADADVLSGDLQLEPGESHSFYYGSWTTANGTYAPYLGRDAWWCTEYYIRAGAGAAYTFEGEGVPPVLAYFIENDTDVDGDGREDHVDWAGSYGVQANYNIWNYQAAHPVLTAGKVADALGSDVDVTLVVRNLGYLDGEGVLVDTVPAGWGADGFTTDPDALIDNADGTTTLVWDVAVEGTGGAALAASVEIGYTLFRAAEANSDAMRLDLPVATVEYEDGVDLQTSSSLPAVAFNVDVNGDGVVECATDEVCDGRDNDQDGAIDDGFDQDGDGFTTCEGDCNDASATVFPGGGELCDRIDNDCDGVVPATELDDDSDGMTECEGDCADADATTYAGAAELCDGIDNDCDTVVPATEVDDDGDGMVECEGDCDDEDATVYAGATEQCDRLDNDCDGVLPDDEVDADLDGMTSCGGDCVDTDATVYAGATELCDRLDNDCDGFLPGFESDFDGDGMSSCEGDCDDADAATLPGADELCDAIDNDCDGVVPSTELDDDGDGLAECTGDCNDAASTVYTGAIELCDRVDNDCDGVVPSDEVDGDGDGVTACEFDCDDADATVYPSAPEVCDDQDNDCDLDVDEGCGTISGYVWLDTGKSLGVWETGEAPISGHVVTLVGPDCDGSGSPDEYTATTGSDGYYGFEGLCNGEWIVEAETHAYDTFTTDNPQVVDLTVGEDVTHVDFGIYRPMTTRTIGYWKTHACSVEPYLPITMGTEVFTTTAQVTAYLGTSTSDKRLLLGKQLLGALLNQVAFGSDAFYWADYDRDGTVETVAELLYNSTYAYQYSVSSRYSTYQSNLNSYNNYGDTGAFPPGFVTCSASK